MFFAGFWVLQFKHLAAGQLKIVTSVLLDLQDLSYLAGFIDRFVCCLLAVWFSALSESILPFAACHLSFFYFYLDFYSLRFRLSAWKLRVNFHTNGDSRIFHVFCLCYAVFQSKRFSFTNGFRWNICIFIVSVALLADCLIAASDFVSFCVSFGQKFI